ncbi:MAG: hypothetical protein Ct9H90mP8_2740 [Pseudomonadota bacterium]|nr:MAG: hypothetical protein Ct9H90mP8_2740 [Pseudomonadota bacterium]
MMRSPFKSFGWVGFLALVGGIWAIGSYIYVVFEKPIAPNPEGSSILLIPRGPPYSQVKKELRETGIGQPTQTLPLFVPLSQCGFTYSRWRV